MAKKISELPTMTTVTAGDYLIVNDGDIDTRKIEFNNFANKFVRTDTDSTISGSLTLVSGTLSCQNLVLDSDLLTIDANAGFIGIGTATPAQKVDIHGNLQVSNGSQLRLSNITNEYAISFQAPTLTESSGDAFPDSLPAADGSALACGPDGDMYWMPTASSVISGAQVVSMVNTVPTTTSSPGTKGQVAVDNNYLYVCREDNIWVRAFLDTSAW